MTGEQTRKQNRVIYKRPEVQTGTIIHISTNVEKIKYKTQKKNPDYTNNKLRENNLKIALKNPYQNPLKTIFQKFFLNNPYQNPTKKFF